MENFCVFCFSCKSTVLYESQPTKLHLVKKKNLFTTVINGIQNLKSACKRWEHQGIHTIVLCSRYRSYRYLEMIKWHMFISEFVLKAELRGRQAEPHTHIYRKEKETHTWIDFLTVIMASGISRKRIRTATATTEMAATLQLKGMHPWFKVVLCSEI